MAKRIQIDVTFPSGKSRAFKSVSSVARMLSGNGKASGGLRREIELKAMEALSTGIEYVRRNGVYG